MANVVDSFDSSSVNFKFKENLEDYTLPQLNSILLEYIKDTVGPDRSIVEIYRKYLKDLERRKKKGLSSNSKEVDIMRDVFFKILDTANGDQDEEFVSGICDLVSDHLNVVKERQHTLLNDLLSNKEVPAMVKILETGTINEKSELLERVMKETIPTAWNEESVLKQSKNLLAALRNKYITPIYDLEKEKAATARLGLVCDVATQKNNPASFTVSGTYTNKDGEIENTVITQPVNKIIDTIRLKEKQLFDDADKRFSKILESYKFDNVTLETKDTLAAKQKYIDQFGLVVRPEPEEIEEQLSEPQGAQVNVPRTSPKTFTEIIVKNLEKEVPKQCMNSERADQINILAEELEEALNDENVTDKDRKRFIFDTLKNLDIAHITRSISKLTPEDIDIKVAKNIGDKILQVCKTTELVAKPIGEELKDIVMNYSTPEEFVEAVKKDKSLNDKVKVYRKEMKLRGSKGFTKNIYKQLVG